ANHALLREVGVSTPELEKLVKVARQAGALGAKLTGSGLGGFVVVLARSPERPRILAALRDVADPILEIEVGDTHL
ncbi:MAG: mevalonate kinase, partial [Myxococcota bacterium]